MSEQIISLDDYLKSCIKKNQSIDEIALLTLGTEIIAKVSGPPQMGSILINNNRMAAIILKNEKNEAVFSLMQEEPLLTTTVANGNWNGYKMFELSDNRRACYEVGIKLKKDDKDTRIGSEVIITDSTKRYSIYESWVKKYSNQHLDEYLKNRRNIDLYITMSEQKKETALNGMLGTVLQIGPHESRGKTLVLIKTNLGLILMDINGLEFKVFNENLNATD